MVAMAVAAAASEDDNDVLVISSSRSQAGSPRRVGKKRSAAEEDRKNPNPTTENVKKTKKKKKTLNNEGDEDDKEDTFSSSLCSFPMSRVRRLVRGEGGNTDIRSSHESVFLINKASEMFLHRFAQDAFANAVKERRNSVTYHHLSSVVSNGKHYDFLSDFVPEKVKAEDALKAMSLLET